MKAAFHKRALDSFADEIIARARQGDNGLWYAVLNLPPQSHSSLDFSTCRKTREEAVRECARKIRDDVLGIGKYALLADFWEKCERRRTKERTERATKDEDSSEC